MFDVGLTFSNPASAVVSLLLSFPVIAASRDRKTIEAELAALLHSHIAASASAITGDVQNQRKIEKILSILKPGDDDTTICFDGISWHRLLVRWMQQPNNL
jgi:hypothetical protein